MAGFRGREVIEGRGPREGTTWYSVTVESINASFEPWRVAVTRFEIATAYSAAHYAINSDGSYLPMSFASNAAAKVVATAVRKALKDAGLRMRRPH